MANDNSKRRIAELENLISGYQDLYYNAEPAVSDEEFDALWEELKSLDPDNPLLNRVGRDLSDGWPKAGHLMPMGSQSKASSPEEFDAWAARAGLDVYLVQYKLDGASLELQYENGLFRKAVTRGDGRTGDDISPNARRMQAVPMRLPETFSGGVRGEVLMARAVHAARYSDKANCRNAANGLMKRKDGRGAEDLVVVCYDALSLSGSGFSNEEDKLAWLERMGFSTVPTQRFLHAYEVTEYRAKVMALRQELPWDIDGLVVKGLPIDPEDAAKPRPEKQIAYKFSPEEAVTRLIAVEWSESGALYTPIGITEPVRLAGTTVQRANLSNPAMIRNMGLKLGSRVVITKRGEIIPKIETLVENPPDTSDIPIPTTCTACGSTLVDGGTSLSCPAPDCPRKELHRLEKWLTVLDIRGFGTALIKRLHEAGKIRTIADLYRLEESDLADLERMGPVLARKLIRNLHAVEEMSLEEFLAGFDLEGVGLLVAEKLVQGGFGSLDALFAASCDDFLTVDGIAETMAASIKASLAVLRSQMEALLAAGAIRIRQPALPAPAVSSTGPSENFSDAGAAPASGSGVAGRSFCFTGELASMKRSDAEKRVRALGGSARPSVVKGLDYLVTNEPDSGSSKNRKAREYGIRIIGEAEFLSMIGP
jgi:DNA ligase (NAD+)